MDMIFTSILEREKEFFSLDGYNNSGLLFYIKPNQGFYPFFPHPIHMLSEHEMSQWQKKQQLSFVVCGVLLSDLFLE